MQLPEAEELPVKHSDCDITEPKVFKKVSKSLLYEKSSDGGWKLIYLQKVGGSASSMGH